MTYRPVERVFGPPLAVRVPSFVYLAVALGVTALVALAHFSGAGTALHHHVVETRRLLDARALAVILVLSAISSVLRSGMRGVRIHGDGIEFRDVISMVLPRIRRYKWAQIDSIALDQPSIALELWDGTRAFLPRVGDRSGLASVLEKVAHARAIPVRGGRGLDDLPDSEEFEDE